jgi:hypothetical protein
MIGKSTTTQIVPEIELVFEPISPAALEFVIIQRILDEMAKAFRPRLNENELPIIA